MDSVLQRLLFFTIFFVCAFVLAESGFNAVYLKRTEANFTCGNPPEAFYETQQGLLAPEDRVPYTCNASDPKKAYPPENMVDGLLATHWQSRNDDDLAVITISFEQAFFAQDISITFGNYRRPGQIKVEKSTDFGATFTPWHYLVTPRASIECIRQFGVEAQSVISRVDQVLCTEYTKYVPLEFNETIFIQLNHQQRGDGTADPYTPGLQAWMNATGVRFTFSGLFRKFDKMSKLWHHYTVREIEVTGRCDCKGHANGTHCPLNQTTGLRTCQCQGNTCGAQCAQCCPLYNQILWKIGNVAPWNNDPDTSCEPCNCHNHADTCVYNQTVSDLGLSMSVNGSMTGGGVCIDCQHNTRGINCEKCKVYFYRPVDKNQSHSDACKACDCNRNGTAHVSNVSFGDCVRDENKLSFHPGKQPGDCYCKSYVQGRQCDTCRPGYYRLTQENPDGCLACSCHLNGTMSRSDVCQGDYRGQCNCKLNVDFRDCSQCKDGYYDLQDSDINGCKPCNCDVGGSSSSQNCDKVTGYCHCRPSVIGKSCNSTATGFYYPNAHFIQATGSPYKPSTDKLYVILGIPKDGDYSLLVKYTNEGPEVHTQVTVQFKNTSEAGELFNFSATLQECDDCPAEVNDQYLPLKKGQWIVNITTLQQSDQLKLDSVIAIPREFKEAAALDLNQSRDFRFYCSVRANHMSSDSRCLSWLFSITMDFLDGALPCECDTLGSDSAICEEYGGQCSCKPGVEGRDCSRCKPGFYNLTDSGCTPCGCNGPNQVCDVTTGECECPENTVGRTCLPCQCNNNTDKCLRTGECLECQFNTTGFYCQHCDTGTFGNAVHQQCQACGCSEIGSLDQTCDRVSGQCNCKTKVTGRNCTLCEANTFNFGPAGCEDCECNTFGSASLQCSVSGQCPCKYNATGLKCAQCTSGFYGLPVEPCRDCECNATGAIPGTVCTNDAIGQCQCKPGVTGRSCDQCMKFFTDLSDTGCEACSMCVQNLRAMIVNNSGHVNETDVKVHSLKQLTDFSEPMVAVSSSLRQAKAGREQFYSRISAGNQLYQDLITSHVPETNNSLNKFSVRAGDLSRFANEAATNTTKILEEITTEKEATLSARQYVTSVDVIIGDIRQALEEYKADASRALTHSTEAWRKIMERNFTQYSWNITEHTRMAENISAHVEQTLTRIFSQLFRARALEDSIQQKAANFNQIQESWNQSNTLFMDSIEQVYNHSREIHAILIDTKNLVEDELLALNNTSVLLAKAKATLNDTRNVLITGNSIFEQYRSTLLPVNGELEVSMLQYEQEQTQFAIRIERGRNLPPKDLSSQTSDPYVLVSTIPDWNNEGTQKSSTVNGDLNPDFPFGDVFRFKITMEQLNFTQVRLAVYDDDLGDEDDFMGVAFIDLSKVGDFFDNIITEWYSLIPQDPSDIASGNFVPSSGLGLTDVSNLLETEVEKIKQKLAMAEVKLQQAQNQALYLESLAHQMEQTFNSSRSHGTPALSAIERYSEISELVNRTLDLAELANNTINMIFQQLSVFSLDDLQISAQAMWQEFYDLYNGTLERNITVQTNQKSCRAVLISCDIKSLTYDDMAMLSWSLGGKGYDLERTIHEANLTFINSVTIWNQIYEQFPAIQDAAVKFQNVTGKAPAVIPPLMEAQMKATNTSALLSGLEARISEMELVLETLLNKTAFIKESSNDGITMINEAFTNVQNISARLTPSPTEPAVNATVREAKAVMMTLAPIREQTETHMANVSSKLDQIKSMSMSLPFALYLDDDTSVTLVPSKRTIENPLRNEISFDFKTNVSEGLLVYMVEEPQESRRTRRSNRLTNSLTLSISNNTVNAAYNLGDGPIMAQNPLVLNNDTWYNVYFTRYEADGFLTVSTDVYTRETVMINGSSVSGNTMLQLTNQSAIYLGGLPANQSESQMFDHFNGIIDNLAIDNKRYNLWDPKATLGVPLYAVPRYKAGFFPANGKAASFYGNGFIQHALGEFNISSGYTQMEVDFRTLHQNGIIMAVSNDQQRYIFVLYLHDGYVKFYFEPGEDDGIALTTSRSSYGDGRWYRIQVVHTSVNATLTVNLVGSLEAADGGYVDTGRTVMDSGHVITFGALIPNSVSNFEVTDVFSGDMDNLLLFSSKSASLVPRYFNDPDLMIAKQGVSFSGVIKGKTEYGTRFFGYQEETGNCSYASIDISSETATMSSLTFTFKTNGESGVLLYSKSDTPSAPSLYMTLFHGDLLLWLGNIESDLMFSSSNITFSDNSWRVVHLQLSGSGYELYVNDSLLFTDIFDFVASPLILGQPFYMGGIPSSESFRVPYAHCFKGGMKDLIIDTNSVSFFSGRSVGVSNAGVIPARVPPPIPPSCGAPLPPPTASNNDRTLHFDLQGSKGKGYIGFTLSEDQRNIFEFSFVVGVTFRALSDDGLLLYATDNDTHPTQFFSVELVQGRILFEFNSGRGLVSVTTRQKYSGNGHWYTVYILRMLNFGAILMSNNEYANGRHTPPGESMNLHRLYIGGLPSHVIAPTVTNRYLGFAGCIKDFDVADAPDSLFDLSKPNMTGSNEKRGSCYDIAQPGLGFNGSAWARFDNFSLNAEFNIQLNFRTSSRDGVLFLITGNSTSSPGYRMHVGLELSSGQIVLTYNTTTNESRFVWTEPGLGNDTQSSYLMCQMKWHSVTVTKQGPNVTITLDEYHSVSSPMAHDTNMTGELFVGGYPAKQLGDGHGLATGFKGCLKKFTLDGNSLHFAQAADLSHVSSACPLNNSEKELAIENEP